MPQGYTLANCFAIGIKSNHIIVFLIECHSYIHYTAYLILLRPVVILRFRGLFCYQQLSTSFTEYSNEKNTFNSNLNGTVISALDRSFAIFMEWKQQGCSVLGLYLMLQWWKIIMITHGTWTRKSKHCMIQ